MTTITHEHSETKYGHKTKQVASYSRPDNATLGKDANIVAASAKSTNKAWRELAAAQKILIAHDVKNTKDGNHRTRLCHAARAFQAETITLKLSSDPEHSHATLAGVQTCGSVWSCPVCSKRIALQRAQEISKALDWAASNKYTPIMLTLTASHNAGMALDDFKNRFKAAFRMMTQSRRWRSLKSSVELKHTIKAVEVTHGKNGWHYHYHGLMFMPNNRLIRMDNTKQGQLQRDIAELWLHCLTANGLSGLAEHAVDISFHGNVKQTYLAKLGLTADDRSNARYELSSGANKTAGGRNIWQILRNASRGNAADERLYVEFVQAMQGENWITWSHGFKALVGADEIDDQKASENDTEIEFKDWLEITDEQYSPVRKLRCYAELLDIAASTRSKQDVLDYLRWLLIEVNEANQNKHRKRHLNKMRQQYSRAITAMACYRREVASGYVDTGLEYFTYISKKISDLKAELLSNSYMHKNGQ